jgi:hypothetical protein
METTMEFTKLEKVEIGGRKGKILSQFVVTIYEEFQELFKVFTERTYDLKLMQIIYIFSENVRYCLFKHLNYRQLQHISSVPSSVCL